MKTTQRGTLSSVPAPVCRSGEEGENMGHGSVAELCWLCTKAWVYSEHHICKNSSSYD